MKILKKTIGLASILLLTSCSSPDIRHKIGSSAMDTTADNYPVERWQWPTTGSIIGRFAEKKGLDIAGKKGQAVRAAADGEVIYVGNALRGYGNLVIIEHNATYRTAYAHNDYINVTEGEQVFAGQQIATMGNSESKTPHLHFEIRENGNAVDPYLYLPK